MAVIHYVPYMLIGFGSSLRVYGEPWGAFGLMMALLGVVFAVRHALEEEV